jgi:spore cortex biosynthesis protein YabQ
MINSLSEQLSFLCFSLLAGVLTGMMYDIYKLISKGGDSKKIISYIEDILFWSLEAIIIFIFLSYTNHAFISSYVYICICIGLIIYLKYLSKYFIAIECTIIGWVLKFIRIVINIIIYPIKIIIYKIRTKN